jgi:predicted nucleic acid-binding protein
VKLLADTSALLALALRDDRHHRAAVAVIRDGPQIRFILAELILAEVVSRMRARTDARRAAAVGRSVLDSRRYELVLADTTLLDGALVRLARLADKRLSLTDCLSFELIERLGLAGAFAFDRDFRDCGYRMVP